MKRLTPETSKIIEQIITSWDDYAQMNFKAVVQRFRVFHLKDLPHDAQRALRRGAPLGGLYRIWNRIAKGVVNLIDLKDLQCVEDEEQQQAELHCNGNDKKEYQRRIVFPFFLAAFPETALALTRELHSLLEESRCSALWNRAIMLLRSEGHEVLAEEGCDIEICEQYQRTIEELVASIPEGSDLWFCFGLREYLWNALNDALTHEALGEPFMPYGAKMLRCAPGNPIWLTQTLTPEGYALASEAQRKQVEAYIDHMLHGISAGPPPGSMKYFRDEKDFRETMIRLIQQVYKVGRSPKQSLIAKLFVNQFSEHPLADLTPVHQMRDFDQQVANMVRYIQARQKEYRLSWEKLLHLAGISAKNTSR